MTFLDREFCPNYSRNRFELEALKAIKPKDTIRYSTKADSSYTLPKEFSKNLYGIDLLIKIAAITTVEKVGARPDPMPKTPAPKKKKWHRGDVLIGMRST